MKLLAGMLMFVLSWPLQAVSEPVILSVYGDIRINDRHYGRMDFTLSELQALTQGHITTTHPWTREPRSYQGVDLNVLFGFLFRHRRVLGLQLETLNDFSVAVDWSEIAPLSPILAWQENGTLMTRRNKGPLWLMLPFERLSDIQQTNYVPLMAWQLRAIRVYSDPE
ncbi:molybdopterin-binding protein [Oceanisphaera sp.]|uniref:molybdopterin-binding protein n=1 Tax=Oceanisphaera sp. TaxID=1929979 RepID=UPI003A95158E